MKPRSPLRLPWLDEMITFRWETVRTVGDAEPGELETAIREVLGEHGGSWLVTVTRSPHDWRLRLEQKASDSRPRSVVTTTIAKPIGSCSALRATLTERLASAG
jgi:hypothetical protein